MAKSFLVPIDMNNLEIRNFIVQNLGSAPTGAEGQLYYNTGDHKLYYKNNSAWVPLTADTTVAPTTTTPKMDGTAAVGTEAKYAKGDHVHPSDTSRVPTTRKVNGKALSADVTLTGADINATVWDDTDTVESWLSAHDQALATLDVGKINGVTIKSASGTNYGTCSTAAATAEKAVSVAGYSLYSGSVVFVKFTVTNTAAVANLKLNVNSTGAKPIKYRGGNLSSVGLLAANRVYAFVYDGTNYELIGDLDTNTTYSAGTADLLTAGSDTSNRVWQAKILHDYIASAIGAADAMRFKGTIGTGGTVTALPTSGVKVGDTYRVITAGTYASQVCEVGDLIIATATTPAWTVAQTNIDGAITSISGTSPISVTGSGSSRTVAISAASQSAAGSMSAADKTKLDGIAAGAQVNPTINAVTGKPTANQTPGFGSTFTISQISQTTTGQISATDRTVKIPNTTATTSAAGLMSAADKVRLDGIRDEEIVVKTISTSDTSVTLRLSGATDDMVNHLYSYYAVMDGEEVVVDCAFSGSTAVFSVASAPPSTIYIYCVGYKIV